MKNNNKIAFINFYKQISKISSKKGIDQSANNIISNNNQNFKFSFKKIGPNNNNNLINLINQKEKLKFKTSKNSPNNSIKKYDPNNISVNNNGAKNSSKYNYINNIDGVKTKLKVNNNRNKEIFDDYFIKKIRQIYSNKKKIFNDKIKKSKSTHRDLYENIIHNDSYNSSKDHMIFDNSKTKLIKKKLINVSDFKEFPTNCKINLNLTNYITKHIDFNSCNNNIRNNEETNNSNVMNALNNFFSANNNHNHSEIVFPNNQINNNFIEKEKNIFNNNPVSPNYTSNYNSNTNTSNNNTNKILIGIIENKYNNIIGNKTFLNNIKHEKIICNNNDNDINNISSKNNIIKYYIKNNIENHRSRSINKINNNAININNYHIIGENGIKKYSTSSNSKNNSKKTTPNKIKLKIRYKNENITDKNNIYISNINNNINIINDNINFLSGKNTNKSIFTKYVKERGNFTHRNYAYASTKNISYNSLINKYKKRNGQLFPDCKKNKNKSIQNEHNFDFNDYNNNKNKTENSYNLENNDNNTKNNENITDINYIKIIKDKKKAEDIFNNNQNHGEENIALLNEVAQSPIHNNSKMNIMGKIINTKKMKNTYDKNISRQSDSSSIIKINCKYIKKTNDKDNNSNDDISIKKIKEYNNYKEKIIDKSTDSAIILKNNKYHQLNERINNNKLKKDASFEKINQNRINNMKIEILNNLVENKNSIKKEKIANKKIIYDIRNDKINQDNEKLEINNDIKNNKEEKIKDNINIQKNEKKDNIINIINKKKNIDDNCIIIINNNDINIEEDKKINNNENNKSDGNEENNDQIKKREIDHDNIYNKDKASVQNISTQIKQQQESDNYINHLVSTLSGKNKNKNQEDQKSSANNNNQIDNKCNYENNDYLLCDIRDKNEKEEEKSVLSTKSRDCLYYQKELEKVSTYIKKYYSENDSYPNSGIELYLFGREIGHGAFGKVNLCLHIASGHLVAMKTFVKKDIKYKETKEKLKNEVEVLSKLHHPFINQILDSFETETHFFIVMEYVCGDLLSFIRKRNRLKESSAKIIFKQIIEGLKYIHKKKIIHRDIKLDNILIDLTNTIKICDFGVSRKIEKGTLIYERCGTPAYIAPEIYAKIGYEGFQCDIWSAGITLYYILSGTLPFRGSNIQELEKIITKGEYEKISDVSSEANDIIKGMLKIDPKKRLTIDEILKHPWLKNTNLEDRYKLNIFTEAEKKILCKYDIDYLDSSKSDLLENFSYRNLIIDVNKKKIGGNTKSVIYAPYNSCVNDDSRDEDYIKMFSYLSKEEKNLYDELEIKNSICKFCWRVKQANINYELSNNDDGDNELLKSVNDEENKKNKNNYCKNEDNLFKNKSIDYSTDYENIQIDKNILEYIEKNVGYNKKYVIKCLKKNIINYATATYYLLYKDQMNNKKLPNIIENKNIL